MLFLFSLIFINWWWPVEYEYASGIFPDPFNCSKYYICVDQVPYHKSCKDGKYFNTDFKICDNIENVDCGLRAFKMETKSPKMPNKVMGVYILLSHDGSRGYETNSTWVPKLHPWQQTNLNLLFFSFVNPGHMQVPLSFIKLARSRGTDKEGSVSVNTFIIFSIGGASYSRDPDPWFWLESKSAAEAMATEVSEWPQKYGCDGIDLDIEKGAGSTHKAGENLIHFMRKLKSLNPKIVITHAVGGHPHIQAQVDVVNESWNKDATSNHLEDGIGIMVYSGTDSLKSVTNYAEASNKSEGFPIHVNVPRSSISVGCKGVSSSEDICSLASTAVTDDLLGMMVWYASVIGGYHFDESYDASSSSASIEAYGKAKQIFDKYNE